MLFREQLKPLCNHFWTQFIWLCLSRFPIAIETCHLWSRVIHGHLPGSSAHTLKLWSDLLSCSFIQRWNTVCMVFPTKRKKTTVTTSYLNSTKIFQALRSSPNLIRTIVGHKKSLVSPSAAQRRPQMEFLAQSVDNCSVLIHSISVWQAG